MTPHHPPLPFPSHAPSPPSSPRAPCSPAENEHVSEAKGWGVGGSEAPQGSATAAPAAPQPPPGHRDRRAAPGRESGGSLGGARANAAPSTAPRAGRGRGVAAFVPGDLLPLRGEAEGASERPGRPGSREGGARWLRVADPSHLSNLTQKGDADMDKVCPQKAARDPAGVAPGGHRGQPGGGRRRRWGRDGAAEGR